MCAAERKREDGETYFVHLSGENSSLAIRELEGATGALGFECKTIDISPQVVTVKGPISVKDWRSLAVRTGYVFGVYRTLLPLWVTDRLADTGRSGDLDPYSILKEHSDLLSSNLSGMDRVGMEVIRIQRGFHRLSRMELKRALGRLIKESGGSIDLRHPERTVAVLLSRKIRIGERIATADRGSMRKRHNRNLPFTRPITLSPRLARVLLNTARVKEGDRILDPFCGTGGVLAEGGLMGCEVFGSDISPRMIEGARENLGALNAVPEDLRVLDIGEVPEVFPRMDAVATDPPYGRSTTTRGEGLAELYRRAFRSIEKILRTEGRCVMVLPSLSYLSDLPGALRLESTVSHRAHRSLIRHVVSLVKR